MSSMQQPGNVLSYASPFAPMGGGPQLPVWREGNILAFVQNSQLPPVCIKCGAPIQPPLMRRALYWHAPWIYITILAGLLIYAVIALVMRKSATVYIGLCPTHRAKRRNGILLGLAIMFIGIGCFPLCGVVGDDAAIAVLVIVGILMFFTGMIWAIIAARLVRPTFIDDFYVRLKGAGEGYLASLPTSYAPAGPPMGYMYPQPGYYPPQGYPQPYPPQGYPPQAQYPAPYPAQYPARPQYPPPAQYPPQYPPAG